MADPLHDCALVIMAKAPCAGRVKTRLEPVVPPDALVALYRCLIEDTVSLARDAGVPRIVFASSSAVFGDDPILPKVEERIGRAASPYGLSKHINELYAGVFAYCYGFK